ncbi:MAG: hypothetical protein PHW13_11270 [Methylococcales bacterium]|nr:hypothetical protein [Methylococcales bacterium]
MAITRDIVARHHSFFEWLRNLEASLRKDTANPALKVKIVITMGNHDKDLVGDNQALTYFYEQALGIKVDNIDDGRRELMGRMYGDARMFKDKDKAPYLPFYYADPGFRFFTTHGQWRDQYNSVAIPANSAASLPGWCVKDGWALETWKKLGFAPFFRPCFGDSVAAGVLSTFIYRTKEKLNKGGLHIPDIDSVLDELDLYRPTHAAVARIIRLTAAKRKSSLNPEAVQIIEETLYQSLVQWLNWDFTIQSSYPLQRIILTVIKWVLKIMNFLGHNLQIKAIAAILWIMDKFGGEPAPPGYKEMKTFPGFIYGYQIHGEGHTHQPLQGEGNMQREAHPSTYINYGTWRDQIVNRKKRGYRRRSVLRALFILDIANYTASKSQQPRTLDYFVEDVMHWGDANDNMNLNDKYLKRYSR